MSFNRDKGADWRATQKAISTQKYFFGNRDWLDHRSTSQAARIDIMLIGGATLHDMVDHLETTPSRILTHIRHLKEEHGLPVTNDSGTYRFSRELRTQSAHEELPSETHQPPPIEQPKPRPRPTPAPTRVSTDTNKRAWLLNHLLQRASQLAPTFAEEARKAEALKADPAWLWKAIISSMATYGNSRGSEKLNNPNRPYWQQLEFGHLESLPEEQRRSVFREIFRTVNPRYLERKVETLEQAFERIQRYGGPQTAKDKAMSQPTGKAKIAFLLSFYGIGEKYARNIWMDIHDPDVRNYAAIDARLKKIALAISPNLDSYASFEAFYRDLAQEANQSLWVVDRIVYRDAQLIESMLGTLN